MRLNQKWKILPTILNRWTMCFSSYKNSELKVKLRWVGARERKKRGFSGMFDLSEGSFFNICVLSQCMVYIKGAISVLKQFLVAESPLQMMKNSFYFTAKALLVLLLFYFSVMWQKGLIRKITLTSISMTSKPG